MLSLQLSWCFSSSDDLEGRHKLQKRVGLVMLPVRSCLCESYPFTFNFYICWVCGYCILHHRLDFIGFISLGLRCASQVSTGRKHSRRQVQGVTAEALSVSQVEIIGSLDKSPGF